MKNKTKNKSLKTILSFAVVTFLSQNVFGAGLSIDQDKSLQENDIFIKVEIEKKNIFNFSSSFNCENPSISAALKIPKIKSLDQVLAYMFPAAMEPSCSNGASYEESTGKCSDDNIPDGEVLNPNKILDPILQDLKTYATIELSINTIAALLLEVDNQIALNGTVNTIGLSTLKDGASDCFKNAALDTIAPSGSVGSDGSKVGMSTRFKGIFKMTWCAMTLSSSYSPNKSGDLNDRLKKLEDKKKKVRHLFYKLLNENMNFSITPKNQCDALDEAVGKGEIFDINSHLEGAINEQLNFTIKAPIEIAVKPKVNQDSKVVVKEPLVYEFEQKPTMIRKPQNNYFVELNNLELNNLYKEFYEFEASKGYNGEPTINQGNLFSKNLHFILSKLERKENINLMAHLIKKIFSVEEINPIGFELISQTYNLYKTNNPTLKSMQTPSKLLETYYTDLLNSKTLELTNYYETRFKEKEVLINIDENGELLGKEKLSETLDEIATNITPNYSLQKSAGDDEMKFKNKNNPIEKIHIKELYGHHLQSLINNYWITEVQPNTFNLLRNIYLTTTATPEKKVAFNPLEFYKTKRFFEAKGIKTIWSPKEIKAIETGIPNTNLKTFLDEKLFKKIGETIDGKKIDFTNVNYESEVATINEFVNQKDNKLPSSIKDYHILKSLNISPLLFKPVKPEKMLLFLNDLTIKINGYFMNNNSISYLPHLLDNKGTFDGRTFSFEDLVSGEQTGINNLLTYIEVDKTKYDYKIQYFNFDSKLNEEIKEINLINLLETKIKDPTKEESFESINNNYIFFKNIENRYDYFVLPEHILDKDNHKKTIIKFEVNEKLENERISGEDKTFSNNDLKVFLNILEQTKKLFAQKTIEAYTSKKDKILSQITSDIKSIEEEIPTIRTTGARPKKGKKATEDKAGVKKLKMLYGKKILLEKMRDYIILEYAHRIYSIKQILAFQKKY
jgi:hypothetical protein